MEESKILKVEVITRETIKPSSPSPPPDHQESFKISLLDQFIGQFHVPALLFYQFTGEKVDERSQRLKSSLSETLTRFYPFAGRFKDHLSFSCNDEGVEYSEAQVLNCCLSDVLEKPNPQHLRLFIPSEGSRDLRARPQFLVQVSFFKCGGMALGMKFCHKIADAATVTSFINGWANSALGNVSLVIPDFSASTLFPPTDSLQLRPPLTPDEDLPGIRTSRLLFGPSELAALQAKATSINVPRPTRVESVSAFLWRTALLAKTESRLWCPKPSVLMWAVNLRPRLQPPLPDHCFGNLVGLPVHHDEIDKMDLASLVDHLRRRMIDICNNYVQILEGDDILLRISELHTSTRHLYEKAETITRFFRDPKYYLSPNFN